ncbi:MAG: zinc-ribbon domain-containing protein, partial [Halobacteriota archaeon]
MNDTKFCKLCGTDATPSARYCKNCGAELSPTPPAKESPVNAKDLVN